MCNSFKLKTCQIFTIYLRYNKALVLQTSCELIFLPKCSKYAMNLKLVVVFGNNKQKLVFCNTDLWVLQLCVNESWSRIFCYFFNRLPYNLGKRWKPRKYVVYVVHWSVVQYSSRKQFNSEHEYVTNFVIGQKRITALLSFVTRPNPCAQLVPPITELATKNRKVWLREPSKASVISSLGFTSLIWHRL